ncbi:MAG: type I DNA topoisomerase [Limnochordales bacterium]|nr:type I DNA topoisomerase [Limnochordales bacterium]
MGTLVIVESPAKARTIGKFLGRGYTVKASVGHVRDLPKSQFGVDVENDFAPRYITIRGKGKILQELREHARKADRVLLATDPDREGEAISWHLAEALKLDPEEPNRIQFHEITREAVKKALKSPRPLDGRLIDAYQARRVLDRIVGYKLSPLLWSKVRAGLSAGRVQSVAVRLICDREREIEAFVPEEYWSITGTFAAPARNGQPPVRFVAKLIQQGGKKVHIPDEAAARTVLAELSDAPFRISQVKRGQRRRNPAPPFITSTLQQEASRRLGFSARKTMSLAQQLYEGLDVGPEGTVGLITYMRTDATRVAAEAQQEAQRFIDERFGADFRPAQPPRYRSRAGAQAAHEAIRPTSVYRTPEMVKPYLRRDQYRLYRLIWERFVASQMAPAVLDTVTVDVEANSYLFRATGSSVRFPGFMIVYTESADEDARDKRAETGPEGGDGEDQQLAGDFVPGQAVDVVELEPKQHFTQPPPRFTEAMLVKTLEEQGIGRPSTYAQIIDTIVRRGYVTLEDRRFRPTELGFIIVDLLKEHFAPVIDVEFTARMEEALDRIEEGEVHWVQVVREFYEPFSAALARAQKEMQEVELADEVTDEVCPQCGRNLVIKWGRFGKFLACPGYPECKYTQPLLQDTGVACPVCREGQVVERRSRKGRLFYGCSRYPDCRFTSWQRPSPYSCPRCGHYMVEQRRGGEVVKVTCANKECGFSGRPEAVAVAAPGRV